MKRSILIALIILPMLFLQACDFLGGIFKTGIGVGVFAAVVIILLIFFISKTIRRR